MAMNRPFFLILSAWTIANILQAAFTELLFDEAYYWVFSQYLDWGFKDHPPMTALGVRLGSWLLPNELGVRALLVLCGTLTMVGAYRLVRPTNERLFWWLAIAIPMMHIGGFMAVPDTLLLVGTVFFLLSWKAWLADDSWKNTLMLAAALVFLSYSKYHGGLVFFFALLPHLRMLKRYRFWIICGIVVAAMIPHLWWQYEHDWLTFRYHLVDRAGDKWRLRFVPEYLLGQLAIYGPLSSFFFWIGLWKIPSQNDIERSLKAIAWGFLLFFFAQSWKQPTEANWTGPIVFPLLYFGYQFIQERKKLTKWAVPLSIATICLLIFIRIWIIWDFKPGFLKQDAQFRNWKAWADEVHRIADDVPVIFINRYQLPSKYLFHTRKEGYCLSTEIDTGTQYDLLYEMEEAVQGKRVCLVRHHREGIEYSDTVAVIYPRNIPLGFLWVDDFRSYNRVVCRPASDQRNFQANTTIDFPITIQNPTDKVVKWDSEGPRKVTFEYLFIKDDVIEEEGIALESWPITSLQPGEKVNTILRLQTPETPGTYRLRLAWRVEGVLRGKNSGFIMINIQP